MSEEDKQKSRPIGPLDALLADLQAVKISAQKAARDLDGDVKTRVAVIAADLEGSICMVEKAIELTWKE